VIVRIRASLLALVAVSCAPAPIAVVREAIPTPVTTVPTAPVSDDGSGPDADADTGAEPEFDAGTDTDGDPGSPPPPEEVTSASGPLIEVSMDEVFDLRGRRQERSYDALLAAAAVDVEAWLSEAFATPDGRAWDGLRGGRIAAGPGADDIPGCGNGATTSYKDLTQFVAFYCPIGDVVVLDDGPNGLLEQLSRDHGPSAAAVVLAHEYGHALQDRLRLLDGRIPTILLEQQADCVAGAWTGRAARDGSTVLRLDQGDVRTALIAILNVRDPAGVDQFDEGGHGSGFDRIGAFQVGFESGLDTCLTLIDQPLDLMPNQFLSVDDMLRGGNAPYDCALDPNPECSPSWEFLGSDLEEFWSIVIGEPVGLTARPSLDGTTCSEARRIVDQVTLCPGEVVFGQPPVLAAYEQVGDFVLGYLLGLGWVEEVLTRIGSPAAGLDRALLTDCLIGAWVDDITLGLDRASERASTVATSPGDLDEALEMIIRLSDSSDGDAGNGTAFDKIAAFRTGVLGGLSACV